MIDSYNLGRHFLADYLQDYLNLSGTKTNDLIDAEYIPFTTYGIDKRVDYASAVIKITIRAIHALKEQDKNILLLEYAEQIPLKDLPKRLGKCRSTIYEYRKHAFIAFADAFIPEFRKIKREY